MTTFSNAITCFLVGAAFTFTPLPAAANGAFPDSGQLLLPKERPSSAIVGTNFGLLLSDDALATWQWTCETPETVFGTLYQLGEGPRLFAISDVGLVYTDDGACTWQRAGGSLSEARGRDAFVDPRHPSSVWAIADHADGSFSTHFSRDGGLRFEPAGLRAPSGVRLSSVESAASDPNHVYVAEYAVTDGAIASSALNVTLDGGATWKRLPLPGTLASGIPRIVSVDPDDPARVLLRVTPLFQADLIAYTEDGGATYDVVIEGSITAFLRRSDGVLWFAGNRDGQPAGFQSEDRGKTFQTWPLSVHAKAFAERDGVIYAATDNVVDGFALAASSDLGATFEPVFTYGDVEASKSCVRQACEVDCYRQVGAGSWSPATCGVQAQDPEPTTPASQGPLPRAPETVAKTQSGCSFAPVEASGARLLLTLAGVYVARLRRRAAR